MLFCKAQAEHQEAGMQEVTGMRREIDQAGDGWLWATHVSTRVILAEALLLLALGLAGAMGWMPEELLPRRWHLLLHLLGVTMFLGNILAGAMWMARLGASGVMRKSVALRSLEPKQRNRKWKIERSKAQSRDS